MYGWFALTPLRLQFSVFINSLTAADEMTEVIDLEILKN
jgi:hypothetical protein